MRILQVSQGDASAGGGSRVAEQLARGLSSRGHEVEHVVRMKPGTDVKTYIRWFRRIPGDGFLRNALGIDPSGLRLLTHLDTWWFDVVHMHDMPLAFGGMTARLLVCGRPVALTLHDYSMFTGGCQYPGSCRRFGYGCGHCPQIGRWPFVLPLDLTSLHFRLHRNLAGQPGVVAISPSRHMAQEARRGAFAGRRVHVIPNPVDTDNFRPDLRPEGRALLGVRDDDRIVLFVAFDVSDPRKGFLDLVDAIHPLMQDRPSLHFVVAGKGVRAGGLPGEPMGRAHVLGRMEPGRRLASIYAAADLVVVPSREDNFPCTVLEALSSGTPVLAWDAGGIPEMIEQGAGLVLGMGDVLGLTHGIERVLDGDAGLWTRKTIRERVSARFGLAGFVSAHERLYSMMAARTVS